MRLWHLLLSFTTVLMQRPDTVEMDAQDVSGSKIKVKLSALSARVFQHEFDHLQVHAEL